MAKKLKSWECTPEILCANGFSKSGCTFYKKFINERKDPSGAQYMVTVFIGDDVKDKWGSILIRGERKVIVRGAQTGNMYDYLCINGWLGLTTLPEILQAFGLIQVWVEPDNTEDEQ